MTTKQLSQSRFGSPAVLRQDTRILGASVAEWDAALTGGFERTMEDVKRAVASSAAKPDPLQATSFDVASLARSHLTPR